MRLLLTPPGLLILKFRGCTLSLLLLPTPSGDKPVPLLNKRRFLLQYEWAVSLLLLNLYFEREGLHFANSFRRLTGMSPE